MEKLFNNALECFIVALITFSLMGGFLYLVDAISTNKYLAITLFFGVVFGVVIGKVSSKKREDNVDC